MANHLATLRDEIQAMLDEIAREVTRQQDRMGVLKHIIQRIDGICAAGSEADTEAADEAERRTRRHIRGTILAVLEDEGGGSRTAQVIRHAVESRIGDVKDSVLARSLSSLVGDGRVVERDGVFSLPRTAAGQAVPMADAAQ